MSIELNSGLINGRRTAVNARRLEGQSQEIHHWSRRASFWFVAATSLLLWAALFSGAAAVVGALG